MLSKLKDSCGSPEIELQNVKIISIQYYYLVFPVALYVDP